MNRKTISIIIAMSLLLNVSACTNNSQKTITADTPYYSVTVGSEIREKNAYMDLIAQIPKITYSNSDGSSLIDPINTEINDSLTSLLNEAKEKALTTYQSYLESAKQNAQNEMESRKEALNEKYKDVKIASRSMPNFDMPFNFNAPFNSEKPFNTDAPFNFDQNKNRQRKGTVNGFTNTDVIIPGLHNKNIIVIETTEAKIEETTVREAMPGKRFSSEGFNGNMSNGNMASGDFNFEGFDKPKRASRSNFERNNKRESTIAPEETTTKEKIETKAKETIKETIKETTVKNDVAPEENTTSTRPRFGFNFGRNIAPSEKATRSQIPEELTEDSYYRELGRIIRMGTPDDYSLTMQYIPTTIKCNFEVKCLDEDYLSLFVELTESRTTSAVKRLFYNVDLNKKKIINIKDILGDNFKETCTTAINKAIEKWTDEQKAMLIENYSVENYINESAPFFINNNHKPVVEIEKFAITIGSTGYHEFQIA